MLNSICRHTITAGLGVGDQPETMGCAADESSQNSLAARPDLGRIVRAGSGFLDGVLDVVYILVGQLQVRRTDPSIAARSYSAPRLRLTSTRSPRS